MRTLVMLSFFFLSCSKQTQEVKKIRQPVLNPPTAHQDNHISLVDRLDAAWIANYTSCSCRDLNSLQGKRDSIKCMAQFYLCPGFVRDTFIDLNFDGHKDYVIINYGCCGSGLKNGFEVFLLDPKRKTYVADTVLSHLPNPSFFPDKRKLTSFYIAQGCGGGTEWHWKQNRWVLTKTFEVCHGDNPDWLIRYPLTGDSIMLKRPYRLIPPKEIMEVNDSLWD